MECLGGNGYVEESALPRALPRGARQLDLGGLRQRHGARRAARAAARARSRRTSWSRISRIAAGDDPHLKAALARIQAILHEPRLIDLRGRALLELLALLAAGVILRAHAPQAVSDAFIAGRLAGAPRQSYGQGLEWCNTKAILERALPA